MLFSCNNVFPSTEYYNRITNYGFLIPDTTFGGGHPSQADCHHILVPYVPIVVAPSTFAWPLALLEGTYLKNAPPTSIC